MAKLSDQADIDVHLAFLRQRNEEVRDLLLANSPTAALGLVEETITNSDRVMRAMLDRLIERDRAILRASEATAWALQFARDLHHE